MSSFPSGVNRNTLVVVGIEESHAPPEPALLELMVFNCLEFRCFHNIVLYKAELALAIRSGAKRSAMCIGFFLFSLLLAFTVCSYCMFHAPHNEEA